LFQLVSCTLLILIIVWVMRLAGYDQQIALASAVPVALLSFFLLKLEFLRRYPGGDPAATAHERRRTELFVRAYSLACISMLTLHVARAVSIPELKLSLRVVATVISVVAFYYLFTARCCSSRTDDAEQSRDQRV
jgi:di/tricarboxylate transporter